MNNIFDFTAHKLISLSALTLLVLSQSASAAMIDDFTVDQGADCGGTPASSRLCVNKGDNNAKTPHATSSFVNGKGILTGQRDIMIKATSDNADSSSAYVHNGRFVWNNGSGSKSDVVIQWDGNDRKGSGTKENQSIGYDPGNPLPFQKLTRDGDTVDLSANTGIVFDVLDSEMGFEYQFLLTDINGNTATLDWRKSQNISGLITFDFGKDFDFKDDKLNTTNNFDFSQVDNFQLSLSSDSSDQGGSVDFALNFVNAAGIPEPSQIALWASTLLGAGAMSRRKKGSAKK